MTTYTHLLELKEGTPNQYRITVLEDRVSTLVQYNLNKPDDGFQVIGYYDSHEALLKVLEPHLAMENSK